MVMALPTAAEEELSCPVCCELFIDKHSPIVLDCRHDVCVVCLKSLTKHGTAKCPQCRAPTNVKHGGVSALKPNYRVRNLAEIYSRSHGKDEEFCTVHADQKAPFVCVSCNVVVCGFCIVHNHQSSGHACKERKDVIRERKLECTVFIRQAHEEIQWCNTCKVLWAAKYEELSKSFENERSNVSKYVQSIVDYVQQKKTEIVFQLKHNEHDRLNNIAGNLERCRKTLEKMNITTGHNSGSSELDDSQFVDWVQMRTIDYEIPTENLQPDMSQTFVVSVVEFGIHPHSINIMDIAKHAHKTSSSSNQIKRVEMLCPRSHASREEAFSLFCDFQLEEKEEEISECTKKIATAVSAVNEGPKRCQQAFDTWFELSEKVTASLDEEVSKISNHSRDLIDEITRQGDIIKQQLTSEENRRATGIDAESDRCRQRAEKLQASCDAISKLTDSEHITDYTRITNEIGEILSDHISYSEKDTDAPQLVSDEVHDIKEYPLYVGDVLITKRVFLRKQLITQFNCGATIIGIGTSGEGYLVIAGCAAIGSLQTWSNISGAYQPYIATEVCGHDKITGLAIDQSDNRYLLARTTSLESYTTLGKYEKAILTDCGSDDKATLNIQSVITNGKGLILIGDIQTCTITVLSSTSNTISDVIPVPYRPFKMTTYGTNVVYTDVTSNRVHCIDYLSHRNIFDIHVPGPTGVCFDQSTGCLYICVRESTDGRHAVGLYCGVTGEVKEEDMVSDLASPQDLCLLQGGKELAVADGSCIKLYCNR